MNSQIIPHIHLLCMQEAASVAFANAVQAHGLSISYTVHNSALSSLDPNITFDLVVSPANSYGRLDGGFDDAISRAWSPKDDYNALTLVVQAELYKTHRGFLPPGNCSLVRIPAEYHGRLRYNKSGWNCRMVAICPTMRVPSSCEWDKEVAYECIWSLLNTIDRFNREATNTEKIRSILMTPLGTGVGGISNEKWANQAVLAMKHFRQSVENPAMWSMLDWGQAAKLAEDVEETHND